jgi:mRNA interferase YafQ
MLNIIYSKKYKKQLRKLHKSGIFLQKLIDELNNQINKLANNKKLDAKYKDHKLIGYSNNAREFHLRPDILVIYLQEDSRLILTLVEIGSHSELF